VRHALAWAIPPGAALLVMVGYAPGFGYPAKRFFRWEWVR